MESDNLFSPNIDLRYKATIAAKGLKAEMWPKACWGAANGWLMLCGPSPGRQDSDSDIWPGGPNRPLELLAFIGPNAGHIEYGTNQGRNRRWQLLTRSICGTSEYANALTSITNLDWGHHANHKLINQEYLKDGCLDVMDLMIRSRPRVVVTLVRLTWKYLSSAVQPWRVDFESPPPSIQLDHLVIQLPNFGARTLVVRSPQHPSRHFFNQKHSEALSTIVQWFLRTDQAAY